MNQEFWSRLDKIANKLKEALSEYGPEAYEMLTRMVQVEAVQELLGGALVLILWLAAMYGAWRMLSKILYDEWAFDFLPLPIFSAIVGSIIATPILWNTLFDLWNWVALIWPDLAVAHHIMQQAGISV